MCVCLLLATVFSNITSSCSPLFPEEGLFIFHLLTMEEQRFFFEILLTFHYPGV